MLRTAAIALCLSPWAWALDTASFAARAAAADTAVQLIPVNGAGSELVTPMFGWHKVANAESYDLQISTRADFSTVERSFTALPDTILRLTGDLEVSTTYYWRVRGHNASGALPYSSVWSFVTLPPIPAPPVLSEPASSAQWLNIPVTFTWQKSQNAIHYGLQISTDYNFQSFVLDTMLWKGETEVVFQRLIYARTYYWRVLAGHQGGRSAFSGPRSFTTLKKPEYVSLRSPGTGTIAVPVSVNLAWASTPLAATYTVQMATDRDFSALILDTTVSDTLHPVRLENSTQYWWRVSAANAAGSSPFASSMFTTVALFPPGVPVLASPADSATDQPPGPVLKWHPAKLAAVYRVQVSQSPTFAVLDYQDSATDTSEAVNPLKGDQRYYWRVQSLNAAGVSAFSDVRNFRTAPVVASVSTAAPARERVTLAPGVSGAVLEFSVPRFETVRISLVEPGTGRSRELVDGKYAAGTYRLALGSLASAAGVYVLRMSLGSYREVRRAALARP